jgi:hypothetical protein
LEYEDGDRSYDDEKNDIFFGYDNCNDFSEQIKKSSKRNKKPHIVLSKNHSSFKEKNNSQIDDVNSNDEKINFYFQQISQLVKSSNYYKPLNLPTLQEKNMLKNEGNEEIANIQQYDVVINSNSNIPYNTNDACSNFQSKIEDNEKLMKSNANSISLVSANNLVKNENKILVNHFSFGENENEIKEKCKNSFQNEEKLKEKSLLFKNKKGRRRNFIDDEEIELNEKKENFKSSFKDINSDKVKLDKSKNVKQKNDNKKEKKRKNRDEDEESHDDTSNNDGDGSREESSGDNNNNGNENDSGDDNNDCSDDNKNNEKNKNESNSGGLIKSIYNYMLGRSKRAEQYKIKKK